jgi:hypothetical protein
MEMKLIWRSPTRKAIENILGYPVIAIFGIRGNIIADEQNSLHFNLGCCLD